MYYREGPLGSFGGGKPSRSGQGSLQRPQPTNDKMSLYVSSTVAHGATQGAAPHMGIQSKTGSAPSRILQTFSPFLPLLDCAGWLVVGFNSVSRFRLLKGVSYGASRDRAICFAKGDADSLSQRRNSSSRLLNLLVIKLCSSMLSLKLTLDGAQATAAPPPSFFQVMLVCSS